MTPEEFIEEWAHLARGTEKMFVEDVRALVAAAKAEERARIKGLIDSHGFVEGCCEDRHGDPACHVTVMQQLARGEEAK